jgi:hypothetical protein
MLHLAVEPIKEEIKKQMLYSKCKLFESEELQIGMQIRDREITFYLTFRKALGECWVRSEDRSLRLGDPVDAKMYNIHEKKQIKFKSKIAASTLFDNAFEFGVLRVDLKIDFKTRKQHIVIIPYHFYHELTFRKPQPRSFFNKSTDWHFCCRPLLTNKFYLADFLPEGKYS